MSTVSTNHRLPAGRLAGADPDPPANPVQDLAAELARRLFADAAEAGPADPLLVGHTGAAQLLGGGSGAARAACCSDCPDHPEAST